MAINVHEVYVNVNFGLVGFINKMEIYNYTY